MLSDRQCYWIVKKQAKRAFASAKSLAWTVWSENLHMQEVRKNMIKVAKHMKRDKKDITGLKC